MEFVLVAPLYILLFGGTFWVGELLITQNMRLNAMRSTAWGHGVRENRLSQSGLLEILMSKEVNNWILPSLWDDADRAPQPEWFPSEQARYLVDQNQSWAQVVGGKFGVWLWASPWTDGWFQFGRSMFGGPLGDSDDGSRKTDGENVYDHVVVMRTKGGAKLNSIRRQWTPRGPAHLGHDEWKKVANEAYPRVYKNDDKLTVEKNQRDDNFSYDKSNGDYIRFKILHDWSNQRAGLVNDWGSLYR